MSKVGDVLAAVLNATYDVPALFDSIDWDEACADRNFAERLWRKCKQVDNMAFLPWRAVYLSRTYPTSVPGYRKGPTTRSRMRTSPDAVSTCDSSPKTRRQRSRRT